MTMTCFQIGCILSRPFAGELIDRLNKEKMLFFTTGLFCDYSTLQFSPSIEYLFVYRFFQGVLFAIGTTAVATVAVLILPKQRKGKALAISQCSLISQW
ncbi:MFS transporter [Gallibacterium anatis]|uniref:MFS transporter n=1 Tax=Gallibacterium anatis TaxID=750 RepID=A0A930UVV2_9PAST|nr:MFS transporter [Gallibacterium anatis]